MAVVWIVLCPGVYRIRKTQIFPAAFQNDFVQMADAGFSAPFMNLPEIDFFFMTLQIKGKITEKAGYRIRCTDNASAYDESYRKYIL